VPESDQETTRKSRGSLSASRATVPCLTILCHPDVGRIGERALLPGLLLGKSVALSRRDTVFAQPGTASRARPLEDVHVSRTAVEIAPLGRSESLSLRCSTGESVVDGRAVNGTEIIARDQLAVGVVVALGGHVALLLHETCNPPLCPIEGILGHSDAIALARQEIERVAAAEVPVLLRGETGTGKERLARAIHDRSRRAPQEYVAVNMATLAPSVAVSTLFGHSKGAFTGAQQRHRGFFERASKGTLFLDEIGETPSAVQPMLLRVIETGTILPLGEEKEQPVDLRLIAATDADLEHGVEGGAFRAALLHRLAGYPIHVPPLRERRDDIPRLFLAFLREERAALFAGAAGATGEPGDVRIPLELMVGLVEHPLPGNARQLRNVARQIALASHGQGELTTTASIDRLLAEIERSPRAPARATPSSLPPPARRGSEVSDEDLLAALEESDWSPGRTATRLGLATSTLHDLMRRRGIRRASDLSEEELRSAHSRLDGDVAAMAADLHVSPRALLLTLRSRRIG
jgi:two-component system nitrogen regulation response regulator GlnG